MPENRRRLLGGRTDSDAVALRRCRWRPGAYFLNSLSPQASRAWRMPDRQPDPSGSGRKYDPVTGPTLFRFRVVDNAWLDIEQHRGLSPVVLMHSTHQPNLVYRAVPQ